NRCKCATVPVQHGFFATELLPALADDIRVPWIDLDQSRPAFSALTGNQGGPGAGKWVQDNAAALAAVRHRPLHQLHGLGRWMLPIRHGPRDEPDVTLILRAAPVVVRAFTPPVQDGFILALIVCPSQREMAFGPDHEGGPVAAGVGERTVEGMQLRTTHANVDRAVAYLDQVRRRLLQERIETVPKGVVADRQLFGILAFIGHVIRRVSDHHVGGFTAQNSGKGFFGGGIATEQSMVAEKPEVPRLRDPYLRYAWD